jgi:1,5-anhydro-D-fructose reductase (1,5-anhydro-D-mannitol-forming)
VHGSEGSLIGTDCMTQRPVGDVLLRTAAREERLPLDHENLYGRALKAFHAAIRGDGAPAATGEDGVRSMAIALAAREAAASGRVATIDPGLG